MDLRLNGQTAIVTGASRGIGLAITRGLVAEGVR
jgi:NAD(P)-dependent dehydrogenase (short-subunit alcohol dehydrogenase family)